MDQSDTLIHEQYTKLHEALKKSCKIATERRNDVGLRISSELLGKYFHLAFVHFTTGRDTSVDNPFDFSKFLIDNNPVTTITGHIIKAAMHLTKAEKITSGREVFRRLAPLVASCIFLDATRVVLLNRGVCG